jgi:ATP-dependent Clp protease ATP-binding subunit ClpC
VIVDTEGWDGESPETDKAKFVFRGEAKPAPVMDAVPAAAGEAS